jgi:hypothetical protein
MHVMAMAWNSLNIAMRPVRGSRIEEMLVGMLSLLCLFLEEVAFKMDLMASLGF